MEIVHAYRARQTNPVTATPMERHTGTNQTYSDASPNSAEIIVPIADKTGTGQKDRP